MRQSHIPLEFQEGAPGLKPQIFRENGVHYPRVSPGTHPMTAGTGFRISNSRVPTLNRPFFANFNFLLTDVARPQPNFSHSSTYSSQKTELLQKKSS